MMDQRIRAANGPSTLTKQANTVPAMVERLEQATVHQGECVAVLENRLHSLLSPDNGEGTGVERTTKNVEPYLLTDQLGLIAQSHESLNRRLDRILQRLQL